MFQLIQYINLVQMLFKKSDSWFQKSHEEFGKLQTSSGNSKKLKFDGLLCPKNTFLQLKLYIQRIYLTLFSTICVKIHQTIYVIFETISHFSPHNSSVSFQLKHYILSTKVSHQSVNFKTFHCSRKSSSNSSCHF